MPHGFLARYAGVCSTCHAPIEPGHYVQAAAGWDRATDEAVRHGASYRGLTPLRWRHVRCPRGASVGRLERLVGLLQVRGR